CSKDVSLPPIEIVLSFQFDKRALSLPIVPSHAFIVELLPPTITPKYLNGVFIIEHPRFKAATVMKRWEIVREESILIPVKTPASTALENDKLRDSIIRIKGYGTVLDVYIPNRKSKAGKRFVFVRFIKDENVDRLVGNLCTLWIGRMHLHANVVRFERSPIHSSRPTNLTSPAMVLDDSCVVKRDLDNYVMGERIVWVDIEGVPLHAWSRSTFNKIGSRWGEVMELEECKDDFFTRKRICIKKKPEDNILKKFNIIIHGKIFVLRAKELFLWSPVFKDVAEVVYCSDDESVKGADENNVETSKQVNLDAESDVEGVSETYFGEHDDNLGNDPNPIQPLNEKETYNDPFNIYDLLKKHDKGEEVKGNGSFGLTLRVYLCMLGHALLLIRSGLDGERAKELFLWSPVFKDVAEVVYCSDDESVKGADENNVETSKQVNMDAESDVEGFTPEKDNLNIDVQEGMVLNAKPYFNEPRFSGSRGTTYGQKKSKAYNERTLVLSLKTMVYTMNKPPKNFEDLVIGHFRDHAHGILTALKAYMEDGNEVESAINMGEKKTGSKKFKQDIKGYMKTLVKAFQTIGVEEMLNRFRSESFRDDPLSSNKGMSSFVGSSLVAISLPLSACLEGFKES
nr:ubiquitin-conjugating enzyme 25 [Tanacetum cinerariifolium]